MARIFVINNDEDLMSLFKLWLEKKSHHVAYSTDTSQAPALARNFQPDILVVDQPQAFVLDEIKKDAQMKNIPVILMTDYSSRKNGLPANADSQVEKPFNPENLLTAIEKQLINQG